MSNNMLIKSLPIVAAALGKKHGVTVSISPNMDTAATNGNHIYLPVLPETEDAGVLARGYIDHEAAHIRYTDFSVPMGKGFRKSLVNILEDIRIERDLGRELPGCKINLKALEGKLIQQGAYPAINDQSHPAEVLGAHIHHGLRVSVLGNDCTEELAINASRVFEAMFPPAMVKAINDVLKDAPRLSSTKDVADMADEIIAIVKIPDQDQDQQGQRQSAKSKDQQPSSSGQSPDTDDDADSTNSGGDDASDDGDDSSQSGSGGDDASDDGDDSSQSGSGGDDTSDDGDDSSQAGSGGDDASDDGDDSNQAGSGGDDASDDGDDSSQSGSGGDDSGDRGDADQRDSSDSSQTAKGKKGNKQALCQSLDQEIDLDQGDKIAEMLGNLSFEGHCSGDALPVFPVENKAPTYAQPLDPSTVSRETNALRTRLNGLVQASKQRRSPPRRVGSRVDTRSLHKLRTLDTRVFRGNQEKVGINTGIAILLDQSGSMRGEEVIATKAALAVSMALDTIPGVELAVGGFHTRAPDVNGMLAAPAITPMKRARQRLDAQQFIPFAGGTTPMTEALWWSISETMAMQSVTRRVVIAITDGEPDDFSSSIKVIQKMDQAGIESHAIGIGVPISSNLFPSNCSISEISELPAAVFGMLQDILVVR